MRPDIPAMHLAMKLLQEGVTPGDAASRTYFQAVQEGYIGTWMSWFVLVSSEVSATVV